MSNSKFQINDIVIARDGIGPSYEAEVISSRHDDIIGWSYVVQTCDGKFRYFENQLTAA